MIIIQSENTDISPGTTHATVHSDNKSPFSPGLPDSDCIQRHPVLSNDTLHPIIKNGNPAGHRNPLVQLPTTGRSDQASRSMSTLALARHMLSIVLTWTMVSNQKLRLFVL